MIQSSEVQSSTWKVEWELSVVEIVESFWVGDLDGLENTSTLEDQTTSYLGQWLSDSKLALGLHILVGKTKPFKLSFQGSIG